MEKFYLEDWHLAAASSSALNILVENLFIVKH